MKYGTKMNGYHIPVLLNEAIELLGVKPGDKYIDCTLGGGGHSEAILKAGGILLSIDQDSEAIENFGKHENSTVEKGNFAHLQEIAQRAGFEKVAGILFDLGVSSHHLEAGYRGFSFNQEADLDMRMDPLGQTITAADLINAGGEKELANLFWKFGEERASRKIAKAIVDARKLGKIETTDQLAKIIIKVRGRGKGDRTHPATRVFQALRLAVNDELESLEQALPQAVELLKPGGRLVVISFHSLEDRIIKNFMQQENILKVLTKKPVAPNSVEVKINPRARSSKLRAAEKI